MTELDFYDYQALIERLTSGVSRSGKQVVFLVGSALTAPTSDGAHGVPGVQGVIEIIKSEFDEQQQRELETRLRSSSNQYQEAFHFLLGRRGPQAANGIIRAAMSQARRPTSTSGYLTTYKLNAETDESACRLFDGDKLGWCLSPGVEALGKLAALLPEQFGRTILTTNFDPLVEVAVSVAGGTQYRTVLHRDGNFSHTDGDGTHVVHLHGYWYGSDTLHTPRQLGQARPLLKASLEHLIRNRVVVVIGYGGWDDAFADALAQVVGDDNAYPDVIWTFFSQTPTVPENLSSRLEPGLSRGRVTLYGGIDCHAFLPALSNWWKQRVPQPREPESPIDGPTSVAFPLPESSERASRFKPNFGREENPPKIDHYVGRADGLKALSDAPFKVGFVTGMGGQGKSALAGAYFTLPKTVSSFDYTLWRDCKEESNKFEDKIATIVEALTGGRTLASELAKQPIEDLADLFISLTKDIKLLIVFDNIDHYVDLGTATLLGSPGRFVSRFLSFDTNSQLLFTCRPSVQYNNAAVVSHRLLGLEKADALELFELRCAKAPESDIERAHLLTNGHALWLDLLAAQVAKYAPRICLSDLLHSIASGNADLPEATLKSIWGNLPEREKIVLQALAETLRPATWDQLADYLRSRLNFNQMSKALRSLRGINLIVARPLEGNEDGVELHPLVRAFIRRTFPIAQRVSFINAILRVYGTYFTKHRTEEGLRSTPGIAEQWLEGAELNINAGRHKNALVLLSEIESVITNNEPPGEFIRVCNQLFDGRDLSTLVPLKHFEEVFGSYVVVLSNIEHTAEVANALERYRDTLEGKDARYIRYCDLKCYMHWATGSYDLAIKWGVEGAKLKSESGVDTEYSTEHHLALAQRDSGAIDEALAHFLSGLSIEEVANSETIDEEKGGAFYGNIGRCLQLMGQIEPALACYRKSAFLIEQKDQEDGTVENEAYIRQWIGELLALKGEHRASFLFLRAAKAKWSLVSPPRAGRLSVLLRDNDEGAELSLATIEKFCVDWIRAPYT